MLAIRQVKMWSNYLVVKLSMASFTNAATILLNTNANISTTTTSNVISYRCDAASV